MASRFPNSIACQLLDYDPEAMIIVDEENRIVVWNRAAATLFSVPTKDAIGCFFSDLFWAGGQEPVWLTKLFNVRDQLNVQCENSLDWDGHETSRLDTGQEALPVQTIRTSIPKPQAVESAEPLDGSVMARQDSDEEEFQVEVTTVCVNEKDRKWLTFFIRDIGPQTRRLSELERASVTDEVSQLINRRGFQQHLESNLGADIGLAIIDVDYFKSINDQYGHHYGDLAIQFVANALRKHFGDAICVARLGGDEFGVVFRFEQEEQVGLTFENFRSTFEQACFTDEQLQLTVSIGIALSTKSVITAREMLIAADEALYESKRGGRNRMTIQNC